MAKKQVTRQSANKSANKSAMKSVKPSAKWPAAREVLFRPDRSDYVRKKIKPDGCVFCSALKSGVGSTSLVVAIHGDAMLMLNKYPYNSAHLLVLPTRHIGNFTDLTAKEAADIFALQKKAMLAVTNLYDPGGYNIGLNLGAAGGAGIPDHLHWHMIPRWSGDSNFFPLIADTKVVIETLERTFERLVPYFK